MWIYMDFPCGTLFWLLALGRPRSFQSTALLVVDLQHLQDDVHLASLRALRVHLGAEHMAGSATRGPPRRRHPRAEGEGHARAPAWPRTSPKDAMTEWKRTFPL